MQTFSGFPPEPLPAESTLTIGVFDGVHRGHAALIGLAIERARALGHLAGVITFDPHPVEVLAPHVTLRYLASLPERLARFASLGLDFALILPFTRELSQTSARDFMFPVVQKLRLRHLVIGHDFTLGHKRQGNESFLRALGREWGYEVEALEPVEVGKAIASSTRIRQLLSSRQIAAANGMLGYDYTIPGLFRGDGTFVMPENRQLPPNGHYQCHAVMGGRQVPCAVEVLDGACRLRWGALIPGPLKLSFDSDATVQPEGFEEVEHTADIALRVRAATFEQLLRQAALGMFALMQAVGTESSESALPISVRGADRETLLVNWLSELLFQHEVRQVLFTDVRGLHVVDGSMSATAWGGPVGEVRRAIKAATFSDLRITELDGFLEATIVFDI